MDIVVTADLESVEVVVIQLANGDRIIIKAENK